MQHFSMSTALNLLRVFAITVLLVQTSASETLTCVSCEAGFYLDVDLIVCKRCPPNSTTYAYSNATAPTDCFCNPGFYNGTERCEECAIGSYKNSIGNESCTLCSAHSSTPSTASIHVEQCDCNPGFTRSAGEYSVCEKCTAGSFKTDLGDHACGECIENFYCEEGTIFPEPCPERSTSVLASATLEDCKCNTGNSVQRSVGEKACVLCETGKYNNLIDQDQCYDCPQNTFYNRSGATSVDNCHKCPTNSVSELGSSNRTQCTCPLGYSGRPGQHCTACAQGKYRETLEKYICDECPADTYNVEFASDSSGLCQLCEQGKNSAVGSPARLSCVCDPGSYKTRNGDHWVCHACATGHFQTLSNTSACEKCAAGKFSPVESATDPSVCTTCSDGFITLSPGSEVCQPCAQSTWHDLSDPDRHFKPCTSCPGNSSHVLLNSTSIYDCICHAGFYADDSANTRVCKECPAGHFCPGNNTAIQCEFNFWSPGGVFPGPCVQCAEHSRAIANPISSPSQCQCVKGAEGTYDSDCSLCLPGQHQPTWTTGGLNGYAKEIQCLDCHVESFSDTPGAVYCEACPSNSFSDQGSDDITDCECVAGYYGENGGTCQACNAGYYCLGGTQQTLCRPHSFSPVLSSTEANCSCVSSYYSTTRTSTCLLCPRGSYCPGGLKINTCAGNSSSVPGSAVIENCWCLPGFWRGCVDTETGPRDGSNQPCVVPWQSACTHCGADVVCANNTLLECPDFSAAPPRSHHPSACVCLDGYVSV